MSRTRPREEDEIAVRLLPCSYCGVTAGEWCRTASGRVAGYLHAARERPVREGWSTGFCEGTAHGLEEAVRLLQHPPGPLQLKGGDLVAHLRHLATTWRER